MAVPRETAFEVNNISVAAKDISLDGLLIAADGFKVKIGDFISVAITAPERKTKIIVAAVVKHISEIGVGVKVNRTMTQLNYLDMFHSFVSSCRQQEPLS